LLESAGVARRSPLIVVNDHTEAGRVDDVVARVTRGERVAVVSDAGTPGVSDPGERLVRAAVDAGLHVEVVPGPSAAIAALVMSGLPAGRFCFEGFLPRRGSGRTERLRALRDERRTVVLYEAPHRVRETVADLVDALGADRLVAIGRELTKLHEEMWRGTMADASVWLASKEPRGEYVLVVDGAPEPPPATDDDVLLAVRAARARGESVRDASASVAAMLGVSKRRAYDAAVKDG
jgi:16S rRNA (cytidine1402-2'-O)-methyltransferase